ncbi:glutathione S-transferase N-terminal domain-containing protein [Neptunomonas marina]|uniref:Glutathione S-transferase n=1 Tax=Neptunomonas marina TaxID=1815562 RepID=A0A437QDC1_9GAMM|nr:glutathione S-transferase N-terminal domain-containing protein [Neptunomonas marina]RVU32445.1 glutathione S-transferase [Neptunomonas marina]
MIDLYTWATPNGWKVSIMLEAVGAEYRVIPVDITQQAQFQSHFLAISPNNKIPAIVDHDYADGTPISLFETGAILIYLAEKYGKFMPSSPRKRYEVHEWLMWQMGGFGPFLGQAHHFNRFAPEVVPYAVSRYNKEAQRLWGVLDTRLSERSFVVDELSIADFAIYPWAKRHAYQKIEPEDFANVWRWMQQMETLPAVQSGMLVPSI